MRSSDNRVQILDALWKINQTVTFMNLLHPLNFSSFLPFHKDPVTRRIVSLLKFFAAVPSKKRGIFTTTEEKKMLRCSLCLGMMRLQVTPWGRNYGRNKLLADKGIPFAVIYKWNILAAPYHPHLISRFVIQFLMITADPRFDTWLLQLLCVFWFALL